MSDTLARLIEAEAPIFWSCDLVQNHYGRVDLIAMAKAKGGDFLLVNRKPSCKVAGCPGRVTFRNRARVFPITMETIRDGEEAWWEYGEAESQKLKDLGWTIEAGVWIAPRL